jgi:aminoglycoside phosphotransferase (APT) family kinase protein
MGATQDILALLHKVDSYDLRTIGKAVNARGRAEVMES